MFKRGQLAQGGPCTPLMIKQGDAKTSGGCKALVGASYPLMIKQGDAKTSGGCKALVGALYTPVYTTFYPHSSRLIGNHFILHQSVISGKKYTANQITGLR